MVKLDDDSQVLFLFKEVSSFNKLTHAKTTEKFSNLLINSVSHNLYTPLTQIGEFTQMLKDSLQKGNLRVDRTIGMIGQCL
mmetsp:Transcript_17018/g.26274  ORF Transcript_17018/g.26274 Transcript_17018/m.26274 type:complete len:81 (-) Transcript_17018:2395-2637(-)